MAERPSATPSDYLAAERTFLAWVRTGLALMGFGFVVARFGLFLRVLGGQANVQIPAHGTSFWFGPVLIALGVAVTVLSAWNHLRLMRSLRRGESIFGHPSWLGLALAIALAAIGLAMTIYLISVRDPRAEEPATQRALDSPCVPPIRGLHTEPNGAV